MSAKLRAPFPYYGSKIQAAPLIERLMGPINNLVIPFAGSLGELLGRSLPAKIETANDSDGLVVNVWRALRYSPARMAELCDHPVHEVTLHAAHDLLIQRAPTLLEMLAESPTAHDVELAAWWVWGRSCWLGGGWCQDAEAASAGRSGGMRVRVLGRGGTPYRGQGVARPQGVTHRKLPQLSGQGERPHYGHGVTNAGQNRERLLEYFSALSNRLRWVRLTCGDWTRVLSPAVTTSHGLTGVNLDPPYEHDRRSGRLYRDDSPDLSAAARAWAAENGDNPLLRITIEGKDDEHDDLLALGWSRHQWRNDGEVVWASPHCLPGQLDMFGGVHA